MHKKQQRIGIFDSGLGGLTVMKQITRALPNEPIIYFGDTARVPYGGKSRETIIRYSIENAIFLMEQNIKVLVIACNTAASCAVDKLKQIFNIPVIDVIGPGADKAVQSTRNGHIAVLGTKATINSGTYQREILQRLPSANVTSLACPLFVPLVEERFISHAATRMIIKEYLSPLHKQNIDTVLLGCTHYPLLLPLIQEELGQGITIVDSASTCAEKVSATLTQLQLQNESSLSPHYKYYVSEDPEKFRSIGREFLGMPLEHVEAISHLHV